MPLTDAGRLSATGLGLGAFMATTAGAVAGMSSKDGMAVDMAMTVGFSASAFWMLAFKDSS